MFQRNFHHILFHNNHIFCCHFFSLIFCILDFLKIQIITGKSPRKTKSAATEVTAPKNANSNCRQTKSMPHFLLENAEKGAYVFTKIKTHTLTGNCKNRLNCHRGIKLVERMQFVLGHQMSWLCRLKH